MSNTSAGLKNTAVRRRAPAPSGQRFLNSLMRVSNELTSHETPHTPETPRAPEPPKTAEIKHVVDLQQTSEAQASPEPGRALEAPRASVLSRPPEAPKTPEPQHASEPKRASGAKHAPETQREPELLYCPEPLSFYVRCRMDGPVWSPGSTLQSDLTGADSPPPAPAKFYTKRRPEGPVWMPAVFDAIVAISSRYAPADAREMI